MFESFKDFLLQEYNFRLFQSYWYEKLIKNEYSLDFIFVHLIGIVK